MFFELHNEKRIGCKKLSPADLGTSPTSHQTHIGLADAVLTFLSDRDVISEDSIFIYEGKFEYIDAYFDRIESPDGTFRSPKIRTGDRGCISIVSTIREIAKLFDESTEWYLLWFGLENLKVVFFLFNNSSEDYLQFKRLGLELDKIRIKSIDLSEEVYSQLLSYVEQKVNENGIETLKELEVITQTDNIIPNKKFREYDIDKANDTNKKIGREGEEYVNQYFNRLLQSGQLVSYKWYNEKKESGLPYDFSIQDSRNNIVYLDVKTTGYNFEQKMIFSSQEIEYIATTPNPYCIYRVYKNDDNTYAFRICEDCKRFSLNIREYTNMYSNKLGELKVTFRGAKIAVSPSVETLNFDNKIFI